MRRLLIPLAFLMSSPMVLADLRPASGDARADERPATTLRPWEKPERSLALSALAVAETVMHFELIEAEAKHIDPAVMRLPVSAEDAASLLLALHEYMSVLWALGNQQSFDVRYLVVARGPGESTPVSEHPYQILSLQARSLGDMLESLAGSMRFRTGLPEPALRWGFQTWPSEAGPAKSAWFARQIQMTTFRLAQLLRHGLGRDAQREMPSRTVWPVAPEAESARAALVKAAMMPLLDRMAGRHARRAGTHQVALVDEGALDPNAGLSLSFEALLRNHWAYLNGMTGHLFGLNNDMDEKTDFSRVFGPQSARWRANDAEGSYLLYMLLIYAQLTGVRLLPEEYRFVRSEPASVSHRVDKAAFLLREVLRVGPASDTPAAVGR